MQWLLECNEAVSASCALFFGRGDRGVASIGGARAARGARLSPVRPPASPAAQERVSVDPRPPHYRRGRHRYPTKAVALSTVFSRRETTIRALDHQLMMKLNWRPKGFFFENVSDSADIRLDPDGFFDI